MSRSRFSAWLSPAPSSVASFQSHAPLLTRVYPLWYELSPGGLPKLRADAGVAMRQAAVGTAQAASVAVWPAVSNGDPLSGSFDPMVLRLVLGDAATRGMHIARLRDLVLAEGAQGVSLAHQGLSAADRPAYSAFVEELCAVMHKAGLKVGVCALPLDRPGAEAYDYARLSRTCDVLQVQCYEFPQAVPGPLSPPAKVLSGMRRALTQVDADKLEATLPGYGLRWSPSAAEPAVLDWAAWDAAREAFAPERRDPATVELTLSTPGEAVWYNDSISLAAKLYQTRDLGLDQAALWFLGPEDPRLWALIDTLPDPYLRKRA